ncbi:hypothetical protein Tco_0470867 [Tanacetum coccineum]
MTIQSKAVWKSRGQVTVVGLGETVGIWLFPVVQIDWVYSALYCKGFGQFAKGNAGSEDQAGLDDKNWIAHFSYMAKDTEARKFLNKTLHAISMKKALYIKTSTLESSEQNGVVERTKPYLVEAASETMLSASKLHYHFGTDQHRWGKSDKMNEKGDQCVLGGIFYSVEGISCLNKRTRLIVESIHIKFDEIKEMMSDHNSSDLALTDMRFCIVERRNIKGQWLDSAWIEAMQDDLHHRMRSDFADAWESSSGFSVDHEHTNPFPAVMMDVKTAFPCKGPLKEEVYGCSARRRHFSDADLADALILGKSTSGGIQFLGDKTCKLDVKETKLHCKSSARGEFVALSEVSVK